MSVQGSKITVRAANAVTLAPLSGVAVAVSPSVFLTPDMTDSPVSSVVSNGVGDVVCWALPGTYTFTPAEGAPIGVQFVSDTLGGDVPQSSIGTLTALISAEQDARIAVDATLTPLTDGRSVVYVDFTTKANGAAPSTVDNGQATAVTHSAAQHAPVISAGRYVAQPVVAAVLADYLHVALGANGKRIGCEFTVPSQDSGDGNATVALWDSVYTPGVGQVPQSRAHFVVQPGIGAWAFWVIDGSGHLVQVTGGTFDTTGLAYDDVCVWRMECEIDEDSGNALLYLPDDSIVTVTAAQIAASIAGTSGWTAGTTLKSLAGDYAMLEHFAFTNALTAAIPHFAAFWAEVSVQPRSRRAVNPAWLARTIGAVQKVVATKITKPSGSLDGRVVQWNNSSGALADASNQLNALVKSSVYVDFTSKANGGPPNLDSGQTPTVTHSTSQGVPAVSSGRYVASPLLAAALADYYQVALGANGKRVGCEFTVAAQDSGDANVTIALWASAYTPGVGNVPQARAHFVIVPGTATWSYLVWDGSGHNATVASGTFDTSGLAYDDTCVWRCESEIDENSGNAYLWLPDDSVVTVTTTQVATAIAGTSGWTAGTTLKSLSGAYAVLEHFAATNALTAAIPHVTAFWAEIGVQPRLSRAVNPAWLARAIVTVLKAVSRQSGQSIIYAPGTADNLTLTGSAQEIATQLRQTIVFPLSGWVETTLDVTVQAASAWVIVDAAAVSGSVTFPFATVTLIGQSAAVQSFNGVASAKWRVQGTPGATAVIKYEARVASGTCTFHANGPFGYSHRSAVIPLNA